MHRLLKNKRLYCFKTETPRQELSEMFKKGHLVVALGQFVARSIGVLALESEPVDPRL